MSVASRFFMAVAVPRHTGPGWKNLSVPRRTGLVGVLGAIFVEKKKNFFKGLFAPKNSYNFVG